NAMTLDKSDNVFIAGHTERDTFPATPGAYQPTSPDMTRIHFNFGDAYVMEIDTSGSSLIAATLLGGGDADAATAIALNSAGNVVIGGWTKSDNFPTTVPLSGGNFVTTLSADLTHLIASFRMPVGAGGPLITDPVLTVLGSSGSVMKLSSGVPDVAALLGVVNSAGQAVSPQVSPGGFFSFYGNFPGAQTASASVVNSSIPTTLGGIRVLVDGTPAPL